MDALIITGGRIDFPFAKKTVESQTFDLVISADLGLHFCLEADLVPDLLIGDFDSADPMDLKYFRECYPDRIKTFPSEKDETDTELALNCAIEAGADRITILGGTGERLDHVLGNLQLLKRAMDAGVECFLVDPQNRVRMTDRALALSRAEQFGRFISLIPFTPEVEHLTLRGFAYEVTDFTLQSGTARGISNEIKDAEARIGFSDGILIVVESKDEAEEKENFNG